MLKTDVSTELKTMEATVCFSPFFNDKEVLLKVKAEEVDVILITPS